MTFKEAMLLMMKGIKVTRKDWLGSLYFLFDNDVGGGQVCAYKPIERIYEYDEEIMCSDGWCIENNDNTFLFYDIVPALQEGKKAWRKGWKGEYIRYSEEGKCLMFYGHDYKVFYPNFDSFIATDWVEVI